MITEGSHGSFTWSPCGHYFSAGGLTDVGIWDIITLEKHSTLQFINPTILWDSEHPGVLAYSSDGYYLAGCFGSVFTVWDIQTGGVVKEFECGTAKGLPKSLVWSLDGKTIGAVFLTEVGAWVVHIYDVTSGGIESTSIFQSLLQPHLWSYSNSLWVMVVLNEEGSQAMINIFKIWPIPTGNPTESFSINLDLQNELPIISFSPATYRIAVVTYKNGSPHALLAFDIQSSKVLLEKIDYFSTHCLSPDGSSLVASGWKGCISVWKYTSEQNYHIWAEFLFWGNGLEDPHGCQFSPDSSSILISRDDCLEVQHLDDPQDSQPMGRQQFGVFSTDGTYVVTASYYGESFTITELYGHSSQYIITPFGICGLALTGNILLVLGDDEIVGWRLTAEGTVDEASDDRRGGYENSIWTKRCLGGLPQFQIEGNVGVIELSKEDHFYYNTETGEELRPILAEVPLPSSSWQALYGTELNYLPSSYHDFVINYFEDDPPVSMPWYQEGWVRYPEGEHQHILWLPNHWRPDWHEGHWIDNARAIRLVTASGLVIIKL